MEWTKGDWENLHTTNNIIIGIEFAADKVKVLPEMQIPKEPKVRSLTTEKPVKKLIKYLLLAGVIVSGIWVVVIGVRIAVDNKGDIITPIMEIFRKPVEVNITQSSFAKLVYVKPYYLLAVRHDGQYELRTGGRATWRYNSPGKLVHGEFTRKMGALGSDGHLAIFPNYETGRNALEVLMFDKNVSFNYKDKNILEAMIHFAPKSDKYDPVKYAGKLAKAVNVPVTTLLSALTPKQRNKFLYAIEKEEMYVVGKVMLFKDREAFDSASR